MDRLIIFLLLAILLYLTSASQYEDTSKSVLFRNREPKVSNLFLSSQRLSYSDSIAFCKEYDGKLLSIETKEKDEQAESTLARQGQSLLSTPVWTSGMYDVTTDAWVWSSTTDRFSFTNWLSGTSHKRPTSTQCVYIIRTIQNKDTVKYGWENTQCQERYRFICEL